MVRTFTGLLVCETDFGVEGGVDEALEVAEGVSNRRLLELPGVGDTKSTAVGPDGD